jgi:hypothetical protein
MRTTRRMVVAAAVVLFSLGCSVSGTNGDAGLVGTWRLEPESIGPRVSSIDAPNFELTLEADGEATSTLVHHVSPAARLHAGCTITRLDVASTWEASGGELSFDSLGKVVYSRSDCVSASDDQSAEVMDALENDAAFEYELDADREVLVVHHDVGGARVDQRFVRIDDDERRQ